MWDYILFSSISLSAILIFYKLLLEREKMHQFNRFFLLIGVTFSFIIPLLPTNFLAGRNLQIQNLVDYNELGTSALINPYVNSGFHSPNIELLFLVILILGILIFTFRFCYNILKIYSKVKSFENLHFDKSILILEDNIKLPYTFLNYIFIDKKEFIENKIDQSLIDHELAHAQQWHSIDIIIIEFLKCIFWFNPLLIIAKKTIQLNHEFIADDFAIGKNIGVKNYQYQLLNILEFQNNNYLASNINFQITKKRLNMMTKQSSSAKTFTYKCLTLPLMACLIILLGQPLGAQEKFSKKELRSFENYFEDATFAFEQTEGHYMYKSFSHLSNEEIKKLQASASNIIGNYKSDAPLKKGIVIKFSSKGQVTREEDIFVPPAPPAPPAPTSSIAPPPPPTSIIPPAPPAPPGIDQILPISDWDVDHAIFYLNNSKIDKKEAAKLDQDKYDIHVKNYNGKYTVKFSDRK